MSDMIISIPDAMKEFVDQQVSMGSCDSASDYIGRLLQEDQARQEDRRLEKLLLDGLESGPDMDVTESFWSDRRAELDLFQQSRQHSR